MYDVTNLTQDIIEHFEDFEGKEVSIAGRLMAKRVMGKASFCNVADLKGNIQLYVARDSVGEEPYARFKKFDIGDIIGVTGFIRRTPRGELSVAAEKFDNWERIYGTNPKFNIERTGRFEGGKMQFKIDVQKGVIQHASVYGDFFSTLGADTICAALIGCRYERAAVLEALRAHHIDGAVYRISAQEMAEVIAD